MKNKNATQSFLPLQRNQFVFQKGFQNVFVYRKFLGGPKYNAVKITFYGETEQKTTINFTFLDGPKYKTIISFTFLNGPIEQHHF